MVLQVASDSADRRVDSEGEGAFYCPSSSGVAATELYIRPPPTLIIGEVAPCAGKEKGKKGGNFGGGWVPTLITGVTCGACRHYVCADSARVHPCTTSPPPLSKNPLCFCAIQYGLESENSRCPQCRRWSRDQFNVLFSLRHGKFQVAATVSRRACRLYGGCCRCRRVGCHAD